MQRQKWRNESKAPTFQYLTPRLHEISEGALLEIPTPEGVTREGKMQFTPKKVVEDEEREIGAVKFDTYRVSRLCSRDMDLFHGLMRIHGVHRNDIRKSEYIISGLYTSRKTTF